MTTIGDLIAGSIGGGWGTTEPGMGMVPIRVVRGTDFEAACVGLLDGLPKRFERERVVSSRLLQPGDIVIEISGGSPRVATGRTLFVTEHIAHAGVIPASFCRRLIVDPRRAHPRFVYYVLRLMHARGDAWAFQNQSTGLSNFQWTLFSHNYEVPDVPIDVQKGVAQILGALDDKIEHNRRHGRALDELAGALFRKTFIEFDDATDLVPSPLGLIPRGWLVADAGEMFKVVGGATPATNELSYWGGKHAFVTPKDLARLRAPVVLSTERALSDAGIARVSSGLLPSGTVLMSSRAPIGYIAVAYIPLAVNQGFLAFPPQSLGPSFLRYWLAANVDRIVDHSNGSTFLEISKRAFRQISVVVAPRFVCDRFERIARPMLDRIASLESECAVLTELRDAIQPELICGRMRVRDAEALVRS